MALSLRDFPESVVPEIGVVPRPLTKGCFFSRSFFRKQASLKPIRAMQQNKCPKKLCGFPDPCFFCQKASAKVELKSGRPKRGSRLEVS